MYLKTFFFFCFYRHPEWEKKGKKKEKRRKERREYFETLIYKDAKAYLVVNYFKLTQIHSSS